MIGARVLPMSLFLCMTVICACVAPTVPGPTTGGSVSPTTPEMTVAILVVDKFAADVKVDAENMEAAEFNYPNGEGCVIDPDGSGYKSGGGGGAEHGRLVWATITDTLSNAHGAGRVSGPPDPALWDFVASSKNVESAKAGGDFDAISQRWEVPGFGYIRLVPVDIGDFDTATVSPGIEEALADLELFGEDISRVVLNLSWVIIPKGDCRPPQSIDDYRDLVCEAATADDEARNELLEDVETTLNDLGLPVDSVDTICEENLFTNTALRVASYPFFLRRQFAQLEPNSYIRIGSAEPTGPLGQLLARCALGDGCADTVQHVISIGAAGNNGWEFPMMPALWDSVVSVSGEEGLGQDPMQCEAGSVFCSNRAEITASGTHPFESPLVAATTPNCVPGFDCSLYSGEVKGSSYAAPRLSVLAALYLLTGGENPCADTPWIRPPLGYMFEEEAATPPASWEDLDVATAAAKYCNMFPN
jgi:hypothetical protein